LPTSGGLSVGIVLLPTKWLGVCLFVCLFVCKYKPCSEKFFQDLGKGERLYGLCQRDSATAHSIYYQCDAVWNRIISSAVWQACSPNLNPFVYLLLLLLEVEVQKNYLQEEETKDSKRKKIANILCRTASDCK
jgi:hypothetical protein